MNAFFRKNLTEALAGDANDEDTALDPCGAFGGVIGIGLSRRMTATCMWGVSDPLRAGRGAKKGPPNGGRSRPIERLLGCDNCVDCDTGGTERRR